jgi:mannose-6-phosphate isomerase-like protein (cupin superfamily)
MTTLPDLPPGEPTPPTTRGKERTLAVPIYRRETIDQGPDWMEVDDFELLYLDFRNESGGIATFEPAHPKEHLVCLGGEVAVEWPGGRVTLKKKDWVDISGVTATVTTMRTTPMTGSSEILWMAGHWTQTYYISIFQFAPGRPLEMHYHDNDEYWFVFRGRFEGIYDGQAAQFRPGDMLCTGMGFEHGIPDPPEVIEGVGFTPKLEGRQRFGHLHRDQDGPPVPMRKL